MYLLSLAPSWKRIAAFDLSVTGFSVYSVSVLYETVLSWSPLVCLTKKFVSTLSLLTFSSAPTASDKTRSFFETFFSVSAFTSPELPVFFALPLPAQADSPHVTSKIAAVITSFLFIYLPPVEKCSATSSCDSGRNRCIPSAFQPHRHRLR